MKLGCSAAEMEGSATPTIVISSSSMNAATNTIASVHHFRVPESAVRSSGDLVMISRIPRTWTGWGRNAVPSKIGELRMIVASPI